MKIMSLGLIAALLLETALPGAAMAAGNTRREVPGAASGSAPTSAPLGEASAPGTRPDLTLPLSPISVETPTASPAPISASEIEPAAMSPSVAPSSEEAQAVSPAAPTASEAALPRATARSAASEPVDALRQAALMPQKTGETRAGPESETSAGSAMFDGREAKALGEGGPDADEAAYLGKIAEFWAKTIKDPWIEKASLHSSVNSVSDIMGQGGAHPAFHAISQDLELRQSLRGLAYDHAIELPLRLAVQRLSWQLETHMPYARLREMKLPQIEKDFGKAEVYRLDDSDFVISSFLSGGLLSMVVVGLTSTFLFHHNFPNAGPAWDSMLGIVTGGAAFLAGIHGFEAAARALSRKFNIGISPSWSEWQALYAKTDRDKAAYKRILLESLKARFVSENSAKGLAKLIKKTQKTWAAKAGDLPFEETMAALREAAEAQAQAQKAKLSAEIETKLAGSNRKFLLSSILVLVGVMGGLHAGVALDSGDGGLAKLAMGLISVLAIAAGGFRMGLAMDEKDDILAARRDVFLDFVNLLEKPDKEEMKKFLSARPAALFLYALRFFQEHEISHQGIEFAPAAKALLELADDPAYGLTLEQRREIESVFEVAATVERTRQAAEQRDNQERETFEEQARQKRAALLNDLRR